MRFNVPFSAFPQLVWAVALSILLSCSKDDQSPTRCEIQSFTNSNKQVVSFVFQENFDLLERVNLLDSTGKLLIGYALLNYNRSNQLSRLTYYSSIGLLNDSIITLEYNDNGTLSKKSRYERIKPGDSVLVRSEQLIYEADQVREKLTFRKGKVVPSTESYQLHTYEYNTQKNVKREIFYPVSDATRARTKLGRIDTIDYLYDLKLNPLQKTYFFTDITPTQFSQNNIIEKTKLHDTLKMTSTYVYNNTGYAYGGTLVTTMKKKNNPNKDTDSTIATTKQSFTYLCR